MFSKIGKVITATTGLFGRNSPRTAWPTPQAPAHLQRQERRFTPGGMAPRTGQLPTGAFPHGVEAHPGLHAKHRVGPQPVVQQGPPYFQPHAAQMPKQQAGRMHAANGQQPTGPIPNRDNARRSWFHGKRKAEPPPMNASNFGNPFPTRPPGLEAILQQPLRTGGRMNAEAWTPAGPRQHVPSQPMAAPKRTPPDKAQARPTSPLAQVSMRPKKEPQRFPSFPSMAAKHTRYDMAQAEPTNPWAQDSMRPQKQPQRFPSHPSMAAKHTRYEMAQAEPTNPWAKDSMRPQKQPQRFPSHPSMAEKHTRYDVAQAEPTNPWAQDSMRPQKQPQRFPSHPSMAEKHTRYDTSQAEPTNPWAQDSMRPQKQPQRVPSYPQVAQSPTRQQSRPQTPNARIPASPQKPPIANQATPMPMPVPASQGHSPIGRPAAQKTMQPLPSEYAALYKSLNLKVTADTRPAFTNANLMAPPTQLGKGTHNTVFQVQLKTPEGALNGVFKPLNSEETGWVAGATGIPQNDPQIAMRNLTTLSYARKLGFDVIPDTHIAVLDTGASEVKGPQLGLVMERATGVPAAQATLEKLHSRGMCAEMTKLQLLDHLTGQGDRHCNNFFMDLGPNGRPKVTGIDNDQCFGSTLIDPNGIQRGADETNYGFRGTSLPPVVDTEMAAKIKSVTFTDICEMVRGKLSEEAFNDELSAALDRHHAVTEHIAERALVIDPSEWSTPRVQALLTAQNSYFGRERTRMEAKALNAQAQVQPLPTQAPRQPNADWR